MKIHTAAFPFPKPFPNWKKNPRNNANGLYSEYTPAKPRPRRGFLCLFLHTLLWLWQANPILAAQAAAPLKIATWNMDWLLDATAPSSLTAPSDIPHRTASDFAKLAAYAQHLNADIIGFQEVDSLETAARIFPASTYQIFLTQDPIIQHTGVAVRRGLRITLNPDVTSLTIGSGSASHPLRSGLDATLYYGATKVRLLVVHLKTGCWDNPPTDRGHSCPILVQQFSALQQWVADRQKQRENFIIMGDFNRRMTRDDPFFGRLSHIAPLDLTTAGWASPCEKGTYFIDHILLGGNSIDWKIPQSLHVLTYNRQETSTLSDHCAVSVKLLIPSSQQ
ncbi:endonuclease/exonuclease/phosphatase family protein [Acetobacter indonesiensis]|uniref:endonuclease/exonuclease/phosphatase family protein n=1 Tax=Acetobacter indonesiensis TaxID=104101 RepID=UPI001F46D291|nr:endonuclease/exonuclease/phosphatase family protein [Acetobacter indonesiensis]MCG0993757.1 endonuclease/exonuclease/phosphatase family protein [Acetobacter indonesiensis]